MEAAIRKRFEKGENSPLTWDPHLGGKRSFVCFEDETLADLGEDLGKTHFQEIANRMVTGHYYPPDAVRFFGRFLDEGRLLEAGDRILQGAPMFGLFHTWSMVELYVVERDAESCEIGYVTTARHHGRGIWNARLVWKDGFLTLRVKSVVCPHSWLFWLTLPMARYCQLRAKSRAIRVFRQICSGSRGK